MYSAKYVSAGKLSRLIIESDDLEKVRKEGTSAYNHVKLLNQPVSDSWQGKRMTSCHVGVVICKDDEVLERYGSV
jgi:hypothetical protein